MASHLTNIRYIVSWSAKRDQALKPRQLPFFRNSQPERDVVSNHMLIENYWCVFNYQKEPSHHYYGKQD